MIGFAGAHLSCEFVIAPYNPTNSGDRRRTPRNGRLVVGPGRPVARLLAPHRALAYCRIAGDDRLIATTTTRRAALISRAAISHSAFSAPLPAASRSATRISRCINVSPANRIARSIGKV
jgi:hypothetical protein